MVDNVGIALRIAAPSLAFEKLFPLPASLAAILNFDSLPSLINVGLRRLTSGRVLSVKSKSGVVENMWDRQPLESRHTPFPFKSYFQFRFGVRHLELVVNNVRRHRLRHTLVGRGKKCGG